VVSERRYVFPALAKWGKDDLEHPDAIVEVLAERAGGKGIRVSRLALLKGNSLASGGGRDGPLRLHSTAGVLDRLPSVALELVHRRPSRRWVVHGTDVLVPLAAAAVHGLIVPHVQVFPALHWFHTDPASKLHGPAEALALLKANLRG